LEDYNPYTPPFQPLIKIAAIFCVEIHELMCIFIISFTLKGGEAHGRKNYIPRPRRYVTQGAWTQVCVLSRPGRFGLFGLRRPASSSLAGLTPPKFPLRTRTAHRPLPKRSAPG